MLWERRYKWTPQKCLLHLDPAETYLQCIADFNNERSPKIHAASIWRLALSHFPCSLYPLSKLSPRFSSTSKSSPRFPSLEIDRNQPYLLLVLGARPHVDAVRILWARLLKSAVLTFLKVQSKKRGCRVPICSKTKTEFLGCHPDGFSLD